MGKISPELTNLPSPDSKATPTDEFDQLTDDLRYQQAIAAVSNLIDNIDLSARERAGLDAEIHHLDSVLHKLETRVVHIAVFGMVGRGKSSLLNALVGQPIFQTGPLHGVTQQAESILWQSNTSKSSDNESGAVEDIYRATLAGQQASKVELIDTPGIDEVGGDRRQAIAQKVARQADLILFVISSDLTQLEHTALSELHQAGKPILLVFNKADQYLESDRTQILQTLQSERLTDLIPSDHVVTTAAAPLVKRATRTANGTLQTRIERGQPDVAELKLQILKILQREGKALVALNTLLYADEINEQIVARKLTLRDRAADDTIWKTVITKSIAVALNPITVIDLLSGAAIDVALIVVLARLYGLVMTQKGAAQLLKKIAFATGGLTASELIVSFGLSGLKSALAAAAIPTGGLTATPYVSVALTQAAVSGVSTYAIAQVTKTYLANGATWGDQSPKAVVAKIVSEIDEDSIMTQIRGELSTRLDLKSHWKK
ncbi:MAG: GTP-binding protein [Leptolyngbya foveolarum]|uniref:GTP-binding protein n=1 Tax=Leptolyngbya foveolarum TaxID=47253 RepID=A0A2W4TZ47_9CYAN|nr:MAG: GTP-binding protein [Leptolyngbya foveolarum]